MSKLAIAVKRATRRDTRVGPALRRKSTHGLEKKRVVRRLLELRPPDLLGKVALPLGPQHFAKVRGDLRIGPVGERAAQKFLRIAEIAHAEMRPSHAVQDRRVFRRERKRLFDELQPFGGPWRAIDKRVTERIERLRI